MELNLKKDKIKLRFLKLKNAQALYSLVEKNRNYLRQWLQWLDETKSVEDTKKFIINTQKKFTSGEAVYFGIWYKNKLVGTIGFIYIHQINRKASIGYWLDQKHQGLGIITTACKLLIDYGFEQRNLNRVEISCAAENKKSCNVAERLGFKQEGYFRKSQWLYDHFVDHKFFALLKSKKYRQGDSDP